MVHLMGSSLAPSSSSVTVLRSVRGTQTLEPKISIKLKLHEALAGEVIEWRNENRFG